MAYGYEAMVNPRFEDLLSKVESRFVLVSLAAKRSREIVDYRGQASDSVGSIVAPSASSTALKPLSIALEEIASGSVKVVPAESVEVSDDASGDDPSDDISVTEASIADGLSEVLSTKN